MSVAAHISDRVTDQVIESLSSSYQNLVCECEIRTRSSTPDVLRPSAGSKSSGGGSIIGVGSGNISLNMPSGTPVIGQKNSLLMDKESKKNDFGRSITRKSFEKEPVMVSSILFDNLTFLTRIYKIFVDIKVIFFI